jgi:iron complex outermembrane receptor protein
LLLWALPGAALVSAQSDSVAVTLDSIIVSAPRDELEHRTGDVDKDLTPVSHTVIRREKFEGRVESLAEVIEQEVGVQVRRSGGLGSYSTVSLRGSSASQVLIFLDGILLNDSSSGVVNLGNISLSDVQALEIYRGGTPIQFGQASIGGAVNIVTRRAKEGLGGSIGIGYGSFNTQQASLFFHHKPGRFDYLVSAEHLSGDNNYKILNDNGTNWNLDDDYWEERNNAGFDQQNVLAKVGYDFSENLRVEVLDQWFSKSQGLPSWNNNPLTETSLESTRNVFSLALTADHLSALNLNSRLKFDHLWKEETYEDLQGHIGLGQQHNIYRTAAHGLSWYLEWPTEYQVLSLLAEARQETFEPEDLLHAEAQPYDSTRKTLSLGLQDHVVLQDERLVLTPGFRYFMVDDEMSSGTDIFQVRTEGRTNEEAYSLPQFGATYRLADWFRIKGNCARYVRLPNFYELFGDYGFLLSNDDLKAESGFNWDLGFSMDYIRPGAPINRFSLEFAWFASDVEDVIVWVYDARGVGRAENISGATVSGCEIGAVMELDDQFRVSLNHTYQQALNDGSVAALVDKKLPGRYERSMSARFEYFRESLKVWLELVREEGLYYDRANLLPAEAQNLANAGLSYCFKGVTATFEIRNLADRLYEDFNRYPMPGRSWFVGLSYKF